MLLITKGLDIRLVQLKGLGYNYRNMSNYIVLQTIFFNWIDFEIDFRLHKMLLIIITVN